MILRFSPRSSENLADPRCCGYPNRNHQSLEGGSLKSDARVSETIGGLHRQKGPVGSNPPGGSASPEGAEYLSESEAPAGLLKSGHAVSNALSNSLKVVAQMSVPGTRSEARQHAHSCIGDAELKPGLEGVVVGYAAAWNVAMGQYVIREFHCRIGKALSYNIGKPYRYGRSFQPPNEGVLVGIIDQTLRRYRKKFRAARIELGF